MKALYVTAALAVFSLASAQKTTDLKPFKSLTIGPDVKVKLVQSKENKLVIESGEEEELQINNAGGTLSLNGPDLRLTLYYKDVLENISLQADAEIEGGDEIKSNNLNIKANADAKVNLKINVKKLNTEADSDAQITLTGKAKDHAVTLSSDAQLHAKSLVTENTNVELSSDATADITVKDTVNATASSDASLKIYGNPKKVNEVKGDDAKIELVK
ncbi:DUF2807 domain-containing protein [Flavobacterium zepuense]|uniref:DUF2807 domain-containing protein n=1 Tax=Flavobacterium zepuense TaxID=2593302 RepID=A0A552UVH1_9FLAO|nr:head GIN domain-containing protein [Flavobacterium zepuense]TRW22170.1 DUF2807 domain-containing protein [Flavobacterium zepuense]